MNCLEHFTSTGFIDLLPLAQEIKKLDNYTESEMIEAVCMTFDKSLDYPPIKNRRKWFQSVFTEKLAEVRARNIRQKWLSS